MGKVKPLTIGIIALLVILLTFNFIPSTQKPARTLEPRVQIEEANTASISKNAELIQKNIDFLKEHLEQIKKDSAQKIDSQINPSTINSTLHKTQAPQIQNLQRNSSSCARNRPQLAIIIDDISTFKQYEAIMQLPFKLTPSLFPKSKINPDTPKIAKIAPFYMIHLPLEALNFYQKEHEWLFVDSSKEAIESRIKTIKRDFPNLSYINNHTGSKFTQNLEAMTLLLETLNAYRINFLDSRTIGSTKTTAAYARSHYVAFNPCQKKPLERDVFLDNILEIPAITQQLIQAVQIAKQRGYAIAIGHPHKATILALKNATDYLKHSGVELVYINEIITP